MAALEEFLHALNSRTDTPANTNEGAAAELQEARDVEKGDAYAELREEVAESVTGRLEAVAAAEVAKILNRLTAKAVV